jgi:TRAP-type mannitol/chloroaromatic compound transport system substrate-binding protein
MPKSRSFSAAAALASLAIGLALPLQDAKAQNKMELNMATPWAGGHWLDLGAKGFADLVGTLTEGRIKINVFPAGALGPALKVTETVQKGVADVGHNWPGYDWAIDRTGAIFGGWSGGPNPEEFMLWLLNGDGTDLWKKWRQEKSDVVIVPCGILESEIFMHSHRPVRTPDDMKGLKLRTSAAWAEIAPMLGASTVVMPGSEVFGALERKVVDAIEWGGPGINLSEGFHKIAKYIVLPGLHQPSGAHECMFNKNVWAKIGERDKRLIELAGRMMLLNTYLGYAKDDVDAFKKMTENKNVEIIRIDKSLVDAAVKASNEWAAKQAAGNEWFKRAYENQTGFLKDVSSMAKFRPAIGER